MTFKVIISVLTPLALITGCAASAAPTRPLSGTPVTVASPYFVGETGAPSMDLSGVACLRADAAGNRRCYFVDDETKVIQPGALSGNVITPAAPIAVIPDAAPQNAFGAPPGDIQCPGGIAAFRDLDGEAIALSRNHVYVVGSHGCGRNSTRFRASSFLVARAPIDAAGQIGAAQHSYRLAEALAGDPVLGPSFTRAIADNGLNIEGLTIDGDTLMFGLRAPVIDGEAYIVSASVNELFGAGPARLTLRRLALGPTTGVRELAMLPNGGMLVLAGPAQEQDSGYALLTFDRNGRQLTRRTLTPPVASTKPEGMAVLEANERELVVLVVFDSAPNGGPHLYRVVH